GGRRVSHRSRPRRSVERAGPDTRRRRRAGRLLPLRHSIRQPPEVRPRPAAASLLCFRHSTREAAMAGVILVPLDGSEFARTVVPLAALLARKLGRSLVLLTALEPGRAGDAESDRRETERTHAELEAVAD